MLQGASLFQFFLQKISDKRKIGDCCIILLKNAENEKKRLNLASGHIRNFQQHMHIYIVNTYDDHVSNM